VRIVLITSLAILLIGGIAGAMRLSPPTTGAVAPTSAAVALSGLCADDDGVQVSYTTGYRPAGSSGYRVTGVTVSQIAARCAGERIAVQLGDESTADLPGARAEGIISGPSVTLSLVGAPAAADVGHVRVKIGSGGTEAAPPEGERPTVPSPPSDGEQPAIPAPSPVQPPARILPARAVLRATTTAPRRVRAGQRFVYTIRVRNTSRNVARSVTVRDPLPRGLVLVRATPRAKVRGRVLSMRLGDMRPGQTRVLRVMVRSAARVCGVRTNVAVVNATNAGVQRTRTRTRLVCTRPRVIVPAVTG
jgi:uncharacterized repeat protein (TIGR01451 family)